MQKYRNRIIGLVLAALLAGCNFNSPGELTPTVQNIDPTDTPEATLTLQPSVNATTPSLVQVEEPTETATLAPPTLTLTPTDTPGPYEHTIQENETLGYIVQLYGYTDLSVGTGSIIDLVVVSNPNIPDADSLPGPGNVIFIPRQTATPTPENIETAAVVQATDAASVPNVVLPENTTITQYIVQNNDTIIGIAQDSNVTLEQIAVLNPELDFFSCNFEIPSGGPNCNVPLQLGQSINLPAPTPTPTLSPTPSGNETATPTPTYVPPMLIYPPEGSVALPGVFSLQWVSVGVLGSGDMYLVEVRDMTLNSIFFDVTRDTSYLLPDTLIPGDGQIHTINWTVHVARQNAQGQYTPVGGTSEIRSFQWQSR
ncbi:MAG: LysM peptidoglycan-binding domain-containing protein [Anaerolineae bacterium]|nr:LysM peptidoglycan-binding domain-containing protein [Anaerolineae bacterium]